MTRFGISRLLSVADIARVRTMDNRLLKTERQQICSNPPDNWEPEVESAETLDIEIKCYSPYIAKQLFLTRFNELIS
jgi:hypothetical protein